MRQRAYVEIYEKKINKINKVIILSRREVWRARKRGRSCTRRRRVICLAGRFHNIFMDRVKNGAKAFFGRPKYVSAKRKLATQARWGGVGKPSLRSCKEEFREKILHQNNSNKINVGTC